MFSQFFINRPVFATVISLIIVLAGLVCIKILPIEQYPNVVPPEIQITAFYPGATAEVLADTVAAPIEQEINGVKGMIYMYSNAASSGMLTISVVFDIGTDPDQAIIDVNNRVQIATPNLPDEVVKNGIKVELRSNAILQIISLKSNSSKYTITDAANYVLLNVIDEIKRIKGVGGAAMFSTQYSSMRIWLSPDKLAQYGMTAQDVITAVQEQNSQFAAGRFGQEPISKNVPYTYTVNTKGRLTDEAEFGNIILKADKENGIVYLKDVARIELGAENYSSNSFSGKDEVAAFYINLQPGANALETAELVRNKMRELSLSFPPELEYQINYDTTLFVKISIKEVVYTFFEAVLLVVVVVYLFLQNFRATIIPILAVPVSIIGTFAGMYAFGFSINLLTLFGLILAIGIVVDDAIIVLENVERLMRTEKLSPKKAAIKAMNEVSGPVVAVALVLASVFLPIAFLGGMTGMMYRQFSITIAVSVLISALVALTLTPAMCAMFIKHKRQESYAFLKWFERFFDKVTDFYLSGVRFFLQNRKLAAVSFIMILAAIVGLFKIIPTALVPNEDQGELLLSYSLPPASSLSRTTEFGHKLTDLISSNENVDKILVINGFDILSGGVNTYTGVSFISLKDWKLRRGKDQSADSLAEQFTGIGMMQKEGMAMAFGMPPISGMGTTGGLEGYIQNRSGKTPKELMDKVNEFIQAIGDQPELAGVSTTFSVATPQYLIELDREKAKLLDVSISDIYDVMQATFGSFYINDFTYMGRNFQVMLQSEEQFREKPDDLKYVYVKSNSGTLIPLSALVFAQRTTGPEIINRFNIFPAAQIFGEPAHGYSSGQAIAAMEKTAKQIFGSDYSLSWTGSAYQEKLTGGASTQAFIFGLLMIFLILAALYEKWSLPLVIVLSVPFAILGALIAIWLRGISNDLYFQVGLVTLIGLSAKNAILIVEFAMIQVQKGLTYVDAAIEAARLRFRPIVMTSLAFIFGVLPLAISSGAGAASRHAIGTGMIGGMLLSTFIATMFVPMMFAIIGETFDKENIIKRKVKKRVIQKGRPMLKNLFLK